MVAIFEEKLHIRELDLAINKTRAHSDTKPYHKRPLIYIQGVHNQIKKPAKFI